VQAEVGLARAILAAIHDTDAPLERRQGRRSCSHKTKTPPEAGAS
jgi:hypothetical protein